MVEKTGNDEKGNTVNPDFEAVARAVKAEDYDIAFPGNQLPELRERRIESGMPYGRRIARAALLADPVRDEIIKLFEDLDENQWFKDRNLSTWAKMSNLLDRLRAQTDEG